MISFPPIPHPPSRFMGQVRKKKWLFTFVYCNLPRPPSSLGNLTVNYPSSKIC